MRINHLEESLISIQDEDESLLMETSKKELDIKHELDCELLVNSENKNRIQELTYIKLVKENKIKFLYFLLPFIEIPLAITIFIICIIASATISAGFSISIIGGILLLDSTYNININYKRVNDDDSVIKRVVNTMKLLFMNKKRFTKELNHYLEMDKLSENKVNELTNKLNEVIYKKESLIDELESLEGYIIGVQKVISHNLLENVPESNFAVEFVNLKLNKKSSL